MVVCCNKICKTTNSNCILACDKTTEQLDVVVNVDIYVFAYRAHLFFDRPMYCTVIPGAPIRIRN